MKGEARGVRPAKRALVFFTVFAVVSLLVGLGVVGLVSVVPTCDDAEQTGIPRLQADFGFEGGRVLFTTRSGPATAYGITRVAEGGAFWSAGVRPGDRPLGGGCSLLRALQEASAGRPGEFTVVRKGALPADGGVRAIIRLAPRTPASASGAPEQVSH